MRTPVRRRVRARAEGAVQGVGFRPYVYRAATALRLDGFVRNDAYGVTIEVEGEPESVSRFVEQLVAGAPPLARIERVAIEEITPTCRPGFAILDSDAAAPPATRVSPDAATCEDCLRELFDPRDRRYRYPFLNCTNCGPRFTIVRGIPYDRARTTMASFTMCARCRAEYDDPLDRRFHAQPNACAACGPRAALLDPERRPLADATADAVRAAAGALLDGAIVAVKGLGGYHLACLADDAGACARLRARKHREDKPFALMAADLEHARRLIELDPAAEALLTSAARPIVLAKRRAAAPVAPLVAPAHRDLGVMLPYSPLHHLLLHDVGKPLVMTSGNVSDEPIAYRDDDAFERLARIADLFLTHDRPIETRTEDSVARVVEIAGHRRPLMLRRSRGYVPEPLELPDAAARPVLACGAHLKNAFALARGRRVWPGPHIGDLENYETLRSFKEGVAHLEHLFEIDPEHIAHDLHPEYLSTKWALQQPAAEHVAVQHHHAHLAACLGEHGERGPAVAAIFDGTGYGTDGTVWGGELLYGGSAEYERVGFLWPVRLPGGDAAVREPWRMACAWLIEATGEARPALPPALAARLDPRRVEAVMQLVRTGTAAPLTSSMGRLFDAVAALCGVRHEVTYEGQAAIELEMAAVEHVEPEDGPAAYPLPLLDRADRVVLDARPAVRAVCDDIAAGEHVSAIARRFHAAVARSTAAALLSIARRRGCDLAVLSGGVFQNVLLLESTAASLARSGLRVLAPEGVPPNDGGIAYGQMAVAAARGGLDTRDVSPAE